MKQATDLLKQATVSDKLKIVHSDQDEIGNQTKEILKEISI